MFKDYNENGEKIQECQSDGPSVGYLVEKAIERQKRTLYEKYKDQGFRVSSSGETEQEAAMENAKKMNNIARGLVQTFFDAAEAEILRFIRSGADIIGRFPHRYFDCFELVGEDNRCERYRMNYFDFLREPEVLSDLRATAQAANQHRKELGGILWRILFLLMALPAFFVTLSWEGVQQFAKYEELVRGLLQAPIMERGLSCLLFLLFLLPYVVLDFRYRDRNSPYNPWILTSVKGYFFITALLYTAFRPLRSGEMNFMVEGILWSFYCFCICIPVEFWHLYQSLRSPRQFRRIFRAREKELREVQRLLVFYQTWWRVEQLSGMHPVVQKAQNTLDELYEQYKPSGKQKMNR